VWNVRIVAVDDDLGLLRARVGDGGGREATHEPPRECVPLAARELLGLLARDPGALLRAAVVVTGDDVLGDVHQAAGEVPGVGRPQRGVREALAGAVG
jgi:hypothetical protein